MPRTVVYLALALGVWNGTPAMAQQAKPQGEQLELAHVHIAVSNLPSAVTWFATVLLWKPTYQDERIVVLPVTPKSVILDKADRDAEATLAFASTDVDADFARLVARGAQPLQPPADQPFGVRTAYIKGPASLKIELEGPLKKKP